MVADDFDELARKARAKKEGEEERRRGTERAKEEAEDKGEDYLQAAILTPIEEAINAWRKRGLQARVSARSTGAIASFEGGRKFAVSVDSPVAPTVIRFECQPTRTGTETMGIRGTPPEEIAQLVRNELRQFLEQEFT